MKDYRQYQYQHKQYILLNHQHQIYLRSFHSYKLLQMMEQQQYSPIKNMYQYQLNMHYMNLQQLLLHQLLQIHLLSTILKLYNQHYMHLLYQLHIICKNLLMNKILKLSKHRYILKQLMWRMLYMLYLINSIHSYMMQLHWIHYKTFILQDMLYMLLQLLRNSLAYMQYSKLLMNKFLIHLDKLYMCFQLNRILSLSILMRKQYQNSCKRDTQIHQLRILPLNMLISMLQNSLLNMAYKLHYSIKIHLYMLRH